jgi:hypothetical protein
MKSVAQTMRRYAPFPGGRPFGLEKAAAFFEMTRPVSVLEMIRRSDALPSQVNFHQEVLTPAGTALGGWVDLTIRSDGNYTFAGHMHDSGFDPYSFRVRVVVQTPAGVAIALQHTGHTGGTTGSGGRDDDWSEDGSSSPRAEEFAKVITGYWPEVVASTMTVSKTYEDTGALGTLVDVVTDVVGFLIADVLVGPAVACVLLLGSELGRATGASFLGPGGLTGVVVMAGTVMVLGPTMAIPALVAGTIAGDLLIQHKRLSDTGIDPKVWQSVYGDTLPPADQIILTNLSGKDGRAFTVPNIDSSVLVNLGENYDDPMQDKRLKYPAAGQLLIHELCHAWQIKQTTFLPGLMCDAIVAHSGDFIGPKRDIYTAQPGNDWSTYGMEQQAFLVDSWFGEGMLTTSNKFRYIENNIRMAAG